MPNVFVDPESINAVLDGLDPYQRTTLQRLYWAGRNRLGADGLALRSDLRGLFKQSSDQIVDDLARLFNGLGVDNWSLTDMRRAGRDVALLRQIDSRLRVLGSEVDSTLTDGLTDAFKKSLAEESYRMDVLTPGTQSIQFGIIPDREIVAMLQEPFQGAMFSQRLGLITDDMAHRVQHSLTRSMMAEESWSQAARRIRDEMGATTQRGAWARADTIARTELGRAQVLARQSFAEENADVVEDEIFLAHPGACADECLPKNGRPTSEVGYPIEDTHPNCTCDTLLVPPKWDEVLGDMPAPPSFDEWSANTPFVGAYAQ